MLASNKTIFASQKCFQYIPRENTQYSLIANITPIELKKTPEIDMIIVTENQNAFT